MLTLSLLKCLYNFKASAHFKHFISRLLKLSFSLYPPITSGECHAWFHLNAASPAARNTKQVILTKILVHGRIRSTKTASRLQVNRSPHWTTTRLIWDGIKCPWNLWLSDAQYVAFYYWRYIKSFLSNIEKLRERKRFDSVLWQKPVHTQKNPKREETTQKTSPKALITQRLRTDLGLSWGNDSHPTGVVKPVYCIQTFPQTV